MITTEAITFYYAPQTRAGGTRVILDELGAPYDLHVVNILTGENRQPDYLKINPLGKVPAIKHGETIITEQIAIAIYLGDLFPEAGLTPATGDPDRGTYLRWMTYYAACFEPALLDKASGNDPGPESRSIYGSYDQMLDTLEGALKKGPYLLGDRISVADIQWGMALRWTMMFGMVPDRPVFTAYRDRLVARPSFQRFEVEDAKLAAEHRAVAEAA